MEKNLAKIAMFFRFLTLNIALSLLPVTHTTAEDRIPPDPQDPHQTDMGYWDIHVCNWPDRPPFYLTIFKTEHYDNIKKIEVFDPSGNAVGEFSMEKFLDFDRSDKPPLRVLLTHLPLAEGEPEGWFSATITTKDDKQYLARDYQIMNLMPRADGRTPASNSEVEVPWELSWDPVPGAKHYRVWIRDMWNDGKQIYRSGLLNESRLELPEGLLEPDGWYAWRIHTRDTQSHVLLGEFNHGSLTDWIEFQTTSE